MIAEDELIIAPELGHVLAQAGFAVVGPVVKLRAALAQRRPDAAVLDVILAGERLTPVAQALKGMAIPFSLANA